MRTTLTIDDDVAHLLEEEAHRSRKSMKDVVNEALRRGLSPSTRRPARRPYQIPPHASPLAPGLDPLGFNRLADQSEDDAMLAKLRR